MPDLQTTLLIIIAVSVASKQTLTILMALAKFFPGIALFVPALEKILKNGKEETPEWARQLQLHYNEETTSVLQRLEGKQDKIHDGVLTMNTKLDAIEPCRK